MDYRILGPLEVVDDGEPIDIGSRQQRSLLALLVLHANRIVPTERILEELWHDDPIGKERTLWVYISRLRAILEPGRRAHSNGSVLVTCDHGYSLVVDDDAQIDAHRFEELAATGNRLLADDPDQAARVLHEGLALWRGAAIEDFRYEDFAQADAARLDELRLVAIEDRVDAEIRASRHRQVVGQLEQLVHEHPERERLVSLQMIALYRSGQQADALRAFERHREYVGAELGIVPSPELCRVEEQVLLHDGRLTAPSTCRGDAVGDVGTNPFQGLRAFGEEDAGRFFGRDRLIGDVLRRLGDGDRLLGLVGASGSGKSSLLNAGLVPAIRAGAVDGSDRWLVVQMVPGSSPFRELETALVVSHADRADRADRADDLAGLLDDPEDGILRACVRSLAAPTDRVLLVIDQFEELFTLSADRSERDRFVRNLEVVLDDAHGRVVVAIGLRADLYDRPLAYPRFAQLLGNGIVNVTAMAPDELEMAAERPAEQAGATLEPALVVQLLGDVAGRVGGLPMFQYALTELFDRRAGSVLTLEAYHEMGGVSGALARRAEDLFLVLDEAERAAARQLFLRLVTIVDQSAWARRRVAGSEIATITSDLVVVQAVVERFGSHRLLTFDREPVSESPTVEVAHEALLTEWPRLRRWIDDGREDVLRHARLRTALAEWTASEEKDDYLLSGERLADYAGWASSATFGLGGAEQRFLERSRRHEAEVAMAERARHARELKRDRQARRRLWGLGAVAGLVIAAGVVGALALTRAGPPAIAVVHGGLGDLGENDMMLAATGRAEAEHGFQIDLAPPLIAPEEHLRRLAESGSELIIVGSEFDANVDDLASDYPDISWVAIDPAAVHEGHPNVTEIHFAVEESAYLAGAAAALTTETGRVGFVGGLQTFPTEASRSGFEQGVADERPGVEVVSTYIGPVDRALTAAEQRVDDAYRVATEMFESGVDVIFHDAGEAGVGVTRAAQDWSDESLRPWTIGSDNDEYALASPDAKRFILTSTEKRFDTAVESAIDRFLAGELEAGETVLDLRLDGVGLFRTGGHLGGLDARLEVLESEIDFGHLTVSPFVVRAPSWQTPSDVTVELVLSADRTCAIERIDGAVAEPDGFLPVRRGSTVEFRVRNASGLNGGLVVRDVPSDVTPARLERESAAGIPESLQLMHNLTSAQLGGETGTATVVAGSNLAVNCISGPFDADPGGNHFPLIVRPT